MSDNKNKALMYIVDKDYKLVFINPPLREALPDAKVGGYCYKEINNQSARCRSCPLRSSTFSNNTFFNVKLDAWFNADACETVFNNQDCNVLIHRQIPDNINSLLTNSLKDQSFDVLAEFDLNTGTYNLIKSHPLLAHMDSGSIESMSTFVATNYIEGFDYYRFKKFNELDNLIERVKKSDGRPIKDVFRLKHTIKAAEWVQLEILPYNMTSNLSLKVLATISFISVDDSSQEDVGDIDPLTGLNVGTSFLIKAERFINRNSNLKLCLASIDIDHFKIFNEWYGNTAGDIFLTSIGKALKSFDEEYHSFSGYLGNDNFAIVFPDDENIVSALTAALCDVSRSHGDGTGFFPAIGIYRIGTEEADEINLSKIYDRATIAGNTIMDGSIERVSYYSNKMLNTMEEEYKILHDTLQAIRNDEFVIYFQPKCNLNNGKIFGAEALVRWPKADRVVEPGEFIPILERTGSIVELDMYVWEKSIMWIKSLIDRGIKPVPISVNVSRIDLYYIDVAKTFKSLIDKHGIPARYIEIEITEGAYVERLDTIQKIVDDLREIGFKIALDDFGAGYSSLNVLNNINVDIMKLDIKFLDLKNDTQKGISILDSVINMIKSIDLTIICEGIETEQQAQILKSLGVKYVQGYYFYRPMPLESFEKFLVLGTNVDYDVIKDGGSNGIRYREFLNYLSHSDLLINNILGPVAFFKTDGASLEVLKVNDRYTAITDLSLNNDILYKEFLKESLHYDDVAKLTEIFNSAIKNPLRGGRDVIRHYKKDNRLVYLDLKIFFIAEKDGAKIFYSTVADVTESRQSEEREKLNTRKLVETLRLESVDGWEYDISERCLKLFNPTDQNVKELTKANIIFNFPDSLAERGIITAEVAKQIKLNLKYAIERPLDEKLVLDIPIKSNGDIIWIRILGRAIKDGNITKTLVGSYRNITNDVIYKSSLINENAVEILKESALLHAFVNLSDDIIYQVNNKERAEDDTEKAHYSYLLSLILKCTIEEIEKNKFKAELAREELINKCMNNQNLLTYESKFMLEGNVCRKRLTIYMYMKDNKAYAYFFLGSSKAYKNNIDTNFAIDTDIKCGIIRCDCKTKEVVMVNDYALKLYGYNTLEGFKADIVDGFPIREFEEDKPAIYRKRMNLSKVGDKENINYRIFVDGQTRYLCGNVSLIRVNDDVMLQRIFVDNTNDKLEDLRVIDEQDKRIKSVIQSHNYTKSILMGLNKIYVSSYTCDLNKNSYQAMNYTKSISELINDSKTYEEFMVNYAKRYVHMDDRYTFINMTSREYIKKHITYENDTFTVRYKRLVDNQFKWYRISIIATSFDIYGHVDNIVYAINDIDQDVRIKEDYEKRIEYYKDLFVSSSVDVYSGMLLIDLDTLNASSIQFRDKEVRENSYNKHWDELYFDVVGRIDSQYKNEVGRELSPDNLRLLPSGYSRTIKYRINLGSIDENFRYVSTTIRVLDYNTNKLATLFTIDITDDIKALESVKEKSERDELTGLYNRKRLDEYKTQGFPSLKSCGVLFLDINDLKITNDSLGHAAGDNLIKTAASSIQAILSDRVHGYRYGGDEFVVIAEDYTEEELQELISKWEAALIKCNSVTKIVCSMSLGYTYTNEAKSLDELILEADKEMYLYKQGFKMKGKVIKKDSSRLTTLLKYLDNDYLYIYEINIPEDRYRLLHVNDLAQDSVLLKGVSYTRAMIASVNRTVKEEDREKIINELSLESLKNAYLDKQVFKYRPLYSDKEESFIIQAIEFEGGICKRVAFAKKRQSNNLE